MPKYTKFSDIPSFTSAGTWQADFDPKHLVNFIKQQQEEENLELNPYFQRGHIWNEAQQIAFMEYFLKGGKSGTILYFNKPDWIRPVPENVYNNFVCVDGLQRITAVQRFINNEIKVFDSYFSEYTDHLRNRYTFKVNINDLQSEKEVLQWYIDMNAGGTPHTKAELERVIAFKNKL